MSFLVSSPLWSSLLSLLVSTLILSGLLAGGLIGFCRVGQAVKHHQPEVPNDGHMLEQREASLTEASLVNLNHLGILSTSDASG